MPIEFSIAPERKVVRSRCFGTLVARDIAEHQDALAANPVFEPEFDQIFDLSDVALAVGLSHVFGAMVEGGRRDLRVFADAGEARAWLAGDR